MNKFLLFALTAMIFISCKKEEQEKTTKEKLIRTWRFKETPAVLTNNWEGRCCENRTIFSGNEQLSFLPNNEFKINSVSYGVWELDSLEKNILIDMTSSGGYAVGDFVQSKLNFKIILLNDTVLKVDHSFYRFDFNYYLLEPVK